MLNIIAAMADENRDSLIPKNWPVRRYISSVYAIAGRTLCWSAVSLERNRNESRDEDILDKVHPDYTGYGPVGEGIGDVAGVVGQTTLDIVIHASEETQRTQTLPSCEAVVGVGGFF